VLPFCSAAVPPFIKHRAEGMGHRVKKVLQCCGVAVERSTFILAVFHEFN
jgi:hypothetical protein